MDSSPELSSDDLHLLATASTATLSGRLFALGLRNQVLYGLTSLNGATPMVGEAFTLRYIPSREDIDTSDVYKDYDHPQRRAIETCPAGHVLVVDSRQQGRAASAGSILLTRLQMRGVAGFVTDGTLRDSPAIRKLELPVYSTGSSPMTNLGLHHAVDFQVPIGCAGVPVYPGDVIVGDEEGVLCIPRYLVAQVARAAVEQEEREQFILSRILSGQPLRGNYPPDESTLRAYEEARRQDQP